MINKHKTAKQFLIEKWPERFKNSKLSQVEFAERAGTTRQTINRIMNKKRHNLRAETVEKIEELFKELGV